MDLKGSSNAHNAKLRLNTGFMLLFSTVFSYSTVRQAKIHSIKIAVLFRLFQLGIIGYIIGWNIVYKKGYQEFETVSSTVTSKVKGLGYVLKNDTKVQKLANGKFLFETGNTIRIFDTADYVIPPSEYNSIFVMTNFVETNQTQDLCDEDYTRVPECLCKNDQDCKENIVTTNIWNGIPTGKCIESSVNTSINVCQIASWCPVEREPKIDDGKNLIRNVENFTIFIKNDIQFKLFNKKQRNLLSNITNNYISTCAYLPVRDKNCPVFEIKDILNDAEKNATERDLMLLKGGVILVQINWECNYDVFWNPCTTEYSFTRFDIPFSQASGASGFNFRFSDKFEVNGKIYRVLVKAYGLRIIINVSGKAGKFNFVPLLLSIGAGLGLLSIATIIADCILLNLTSKKKFYRELKELDYKSKNQVATDN